MQISRQATPQPNAAADLIYLKRFAYIRNNVLKLLVSYRGLSIAYRYVRRQGKRSGIWLTHGSRRMQGKSISHSTFFLALASWSCLSGTETVIENQKWTEHYPERETSASPTSRRKRWQGTTQPRTGKAPRTPP